MMGLDVLLKSPSLWTRWQIIKKKKKKKRKKHKRYFFLRSFQKKKKKKRFQTNRFRLPAFYVYAHNIIHFLHIALSTRFAKNLMTYVRVHIYTWDSSCGAKVVYLHFGKFESLYDRRRRRSRGVAIFSNDFRNNSRTLVQQQQHRVPLPWSPRTRILFAIQSSRPVPSAPV